MQEKRYIFTINTRDRIKVPNLRVIALDYETAEQKIKNMYRYCEILESTEESVNQKAIYSFEDVVDLISKV
jgi:dihydroneopterin aldolase